MYQNFYQNNSMLLLRFLNSSNPVNISILETCHVGICINHRYTHIVPNLRQVAMEQALRINLEICLNPKQLV